jgi:putative acyl-CoA dehydrogenase
VCKRGPAMVNEALECLGGNGFVEESILPRIYREAPLNSIWEGSGNVICLDILRAMAKDPASLESVVMEIREARGSDARFDAFARKLEDDLAQTRDELQARRLAERLALALQASLLIRHSAPEVADAFCAARLAGDSGRAFGTLPSSVNYAAIIERALAN